MKNIMNIMKYYELKNFYSHTVLIKLFQLKKKFTRSNANELEFAIQLLLRESQQDQSSKMKYPVRFMYDSNSVSREIYEESAADRIE